MKNLLLTDLLEKEFENIRDYVVTNVIPDERKNNPGHIKNVSTDLITFAYMIACSRAVIETPDLRK